MASNAQEAAEATVELIEQMYLEKGSICDILEEMSLGDVRFEVDLAPGKQPLPLEYRSGKIMVTYGGPTTFVQSNGEVVSYWGIEEGHCLVTYDMREEIMQYFEGLFDDYVEATVKANTNRTW